MENVLRKQMVADAVSRAGSTITTEFVAKFLPDDFELGDDDLAPHLPTKAEPAPEADAEPFDWQALGEQIDAVRDKRLAAEGGQGEQVIAEPEAPTIQPSDIGAAMARRLAADVLVNNARVAVIAAQNVEREARIKLADSIIQFQSGFEKLTPEQLRRDFVREQSAIRQGIKDGVIPVRPGPGIGKSAIDTAAYYQRGGNPAGGGRAYARGARPASMQNAPAKLHGER